MGLLFAATAILSWGFGDFLIQKNARKFGDWIALFFVAVVGAMLLLPFVWSDLSNIFLNHANLVFLLGTSVILLAAALIEFEALRVGKISVIEPIFALEVLVTVTLSTFFLNEPLTILQSIMVISLIVGIFLISTKSFETLKRISVERGAFLAILSTVGMGATNFLFGVGARQVGPLAVNWFTCAFLALACFIAILFLKKLKPMMSDWRTNRRLLFSMGFVDTLAWLGYTYAVIYMPIAIATSLTESYIALAALLGLIYNKERLRTHQYVGLVCCVVSAIILASVA